MRRQFNPVAVNTAWASDITYIHTDEGWLYLATVIDLFNRKIVGWSMGTRLATSLIEDALIMALHRNNLPNDVIHHSDRGAQYCSNAYQSLLKEHGFICSMSGSGNCYDNAVMESFYLTCNLGIVDLIPSDFKIDRISVRIGGNMNLCSMDLPMARSSPS